MFPSCSYVVVPAKLVEVYLDLRRLTEEQVRVSEYMQFHLLDSLFKMLNFMNLFSSLIHLWDTFKSSCFISGFY